jgi:UDP-N-acetylmuramoyl-tripeptide--D-alanyl-D-alanine ligase
MPNALDPSAWAKTIGATVSSDARAAQRITFVAQDCDEHTAFAALKGANRHGNEFIAQALERGAPFVLTDQDVLRAMRVADATQALRAWARAWRDSSGATLIGVTGSAGKTTAKTMISSALNAPCTPGSLNTLNYLACYLLSEVTQNSTHVIEMGIDRIGEMDELMALVGPDFGVVTSIGPAHIEYFGKLEKIASEKGRILQAPHPVVSDNTSAYFPNVPSYGFSDGATYHAEGLQLSSEHSQFVYKGHRVNLETPSKQIAEAAVLALALAEQLNIPITQAAARLENAEVPGGRLRLLRGKFTLIDDAYNANPLSVAASLETLSNMPGRKVAILGHMRELGERSREYHAEIGLRAGRTAELVIAIGEHGDVLASNARAAGAQTLEFDTTEAAKTPAANAIQPGDAVLVKGSRFVQLEQIVEVLRERL